MRTPPSSNIRFMTRRRLRLLLATLAFPALACAQSPAAPHVYALVSAVGAKLSFVRLKKDVGTLFEPYQRFDLDVPGAAIDGAVLRGLEETLRSNEPDAQFVYLRLNPDELSKTYAYERGEVALGKLATAFEKMPERAAWYRIVVVTPRYVNSERAGLGAKLHGIGVYVRPIGSGFSSSFDEAQTLDPETSTPEGEAGRSKRFVAPFFYAQVSILDAQTLRILDTSERYDFQRLFDPESTAIDVEAAIPPEKLAPALEKFVQRASANALREAIGVVTVKETPAAAPR
jgi:hypothetical protein